MLWEMQITQCPKFLGGGISYIFFCILFCKYFENANYKFEITWNNVK